MSNQKKRIETILAILNPEPFYTGNTRNKIRAELNQVTEVDHITPARRKNILKILHATRGLDSTLKAFLDYYSVRNGKHALGQYLTQLASHSDHRIARISSAERARFQSSIVDHRNTHLHQADSYPKNDSEVYQIICEMETLVSRVMTL